ncbi:MAG: hypothetical protein KBG48_01505 [Kofleriaceae bacterium]|jgi:hypothetical protein|nr:hypothetical protein [Kofleriaceae bacterium]MBP9166022.1 hypothetical protein [Kofleriaceae bacterium]MBP9857299.1 hypothetical protein [Kofleriaceae bacterium]
MSIPARVTAAVATLAAAVGVASAQPASAQPAIAPTTAPGEAAPPTADLAPLPPAEPPTSPPTPVGVETEFLSATAMPWEVMVDRQSICQTPCKIYLDGPHWITMRTREARPLRLEVGNLGLRPSQVTAQDLGTGKYATGITFTTLGGMAVVVGVVLTAVGCSADDREGMCTAGLITGGAGALTTLGGIWLIRAGLPRIKVRALERRGLALYTTGTGGGLAGAF